MHIHTSTTHSHTNSHTHSRSFPSSSHTHTHTHTLNQDYTDESGESTDDEKIEIENQYYSSKGLKEDDPRAALLGFQGVLDLEEKKQRKEEWGFKALKQMLKLLFKMVSVFKALSFLLLSFVHWTFMTC